jgi:dynein heavy chain, axonemal
LSDLKNLKTLWDLISLVNLQYNDWKTKFWRQIKADVLIEQNKIFSNQIKQVNKEVRFIKGWQTIGEKVANMTIVLNLVESLRGDYMEDRHWKQLKDKTNTDFDHKASTFCLDDILRLRLYKLKPEVEEIVDIAQKEFKIDKKLKIIESNWAKQIFTFDNYKENYIFAPLDDMMEILDANSLDLMGMKAQGKYVEYFISTVEDWRDKLGRVDVVVNEWLKVQKNWRILVNIFVGSEDIRQQLPEDTKVFETVHGEFTEMMIAAHENPLIIDNCT